MKVIHKLEEGMTGISVELDNSELIVLKELENRLKKAYEKLTDTANIQQLHDSASQLKELTGNIVHFVGKIVPDEVQSLTEAHKTLFGRE